MGHSRQVLQFFLLDLCKDILPLCFYKRYPHMATFPHAYFVVIFLMVLKSSVRRDLHICFFCWLPLVVMEIHFFQTIQHDSAIFFSLESTNRGWQLPKGKRRTTKTLLIHSYCCIPHIFGAITREKHYVKKIVLKNGNSFLVGMGKIKVKCSNKIWTEKGERINAV